VPTEALHVTQILESFCWRVQQLAGDGGFAMVTGAPGCGKSAATESPTAEPNSPPGSQAQQPHQIRSKTPRPPKPDGATASLALRTSASQTLYRKREAEAGSPSNSVIVTPSKSAIVLI
jgi:hypothetical protein